MNSAIPKPDKFEPSMNIDTYFKQFELFLRLAKVDDVEKGSMLLSYLDFRVFEAVSSSLDISKATYTEIKRMLLDRYSITDNFIQRINFFNLKFSLPAESFAASLNSAMTSYTNTIKEFKEEILISKFISSCPTEVSSELRIRRPKSLSECVKIVSAIKIDPRSSFLVKKVDHLAKPQAFHNSRECSKVCYRCGSKQHIASNTNCPAVNAICKLCNKKGHFQRVCNSKQNKPISSNVQIRSIHSDLRHRPEIHVSVEDKLVNVIVDTGSDVSILTNDFYRKHFGHYSLQNCFRQFSNFDGTKISMQGVLPSLEVSFNQKHCQTKFYVADVAHSIIGMDVICGLKLEMKFSSSFNDSNSSVQIVSSAVSTEHTK